MIARTPVHRLSGRLAALVLLFAGLLASLPSVHAQQMLPAAKAMATLNTVPMLMKSKQYDKALAAIDQVLPILEPLAKDEPRYRPAIEACYYNRPICNLQKKDLDAAVTGFRAYVQKYPEGQWTRVSYVLWADIKATQGKWKEVIDVVLRVKDDTKLLAAERQVVFQLWGEALFNLEKYEEALEPLKWIFRNGANVNVRTEAAVMLAVCLTRLGKFEDLYQFVPKLYKTSARFDLRLQMSLMEEGDNLYDDNKVAKALLLYRLVYYKSELVEQLTAKIGETKRQMEIQRRREEDDPQAGTLARQLQRTLETLDEQLKQLAEIPDYDHQLTIRLGNCYFDLERHLESLKLYRSIFEDNPQDPLAQQALYRAFTAAFAMKDVERALIEAYTSLDTYPGGEFWDTLTVNVATIHMERKEYAKVIAMCDRALKVKPDHGLADNMVYLKGYAQFMSAGQEEPMLIEAMQTFEILFDKYPKSSFLQPAQYWHALGYLYIPIYKPAREEFQEFLQKYTLGSLLEDASYRVGVAYYGEGNFAKVMESMQAFIAKYPDSILKSEAHAMLADVQASESLLDEACENYRLALPCAINMVQVDYAMMQHSRTLELEQKYEDIIALWRQYMQTYGDWANYTEALYWIGNSQRNLDRLEDALNTFYDGIVKYGNITTNYGVDAMILDLKSEFNELPDITDASVQADPKDADRILMVNRMRDRLRGEMDLAGRAGKQTLLLRLATLFAETTKNDAVRQSMGNTVMTEANIEKSGPVTLAFMGREAVRRNRNDFAKKVYEHFLTAHRESDLVLEALRGQAENLIAMKKTDEAAALLRELINRFAQSEQAGWAYLRLGEIQLSRKDYRGAAESYETILSVKDWRGEVWAEALYNLGLCKQAQQQYDEAFVVFERNYVLYAGFPDWAGRSFLRAAECQEKTGRIPEAIQILEMMLKTEGVNESAAAHEARQKLQELKKA